MAEQAATSESADHRPSTLSPSDLRKQWTLYCILLAAAAGMYLPFAGIPYFGDDYYYRFENPRAAILDYFVSYHDVGGIFRPFQMAWCAVNQLFFGDGTWVLQAVQVGIHGLLGCLLYWFMCSVGLGRLPSFIAALLFIINPATVSGVLGNDTLSQVGSAALGFLSFATAWWYGRAACPASRAVATSKPIRIAPSPFKREGWGEGFSDRRLTKARASTAVISAAAFGLALLFKETALSFSLILPLTLLHLLSQCRAGDRRGTTVKVGALLAAYVAVLAGYFAYRHQLAPTHAAFGDGMYEFRLGGNIAVNQVSLFLGALLPASTADAYVAYVHRSVPVLAAIGLLALAWLATIARGVVLGRAGRPAMGLIVLAACATVPVTLMNHVSELYTYNMAPFIAVLIAVALHALLQQHGRSGRRCKIVLVLVLLLVAASDVAAVARKAAQMQGNGEAAARLVSQVVDRARSLPRNGRMLLVQRRRPGDCHYSVFLTSDFQGLLAAERWVRHLAGRPDVSIEVVDEGRERAADLILFREDDETGARVIERAVPRNARS